LCHFNPRATREGRATVITLDAFDVFVVSIHARPVRAARLQFSFSRTAFFQFQSTRDP